jgi:hypothetical protein
MIQACLSQRRKYPALGKEIPFLEALPAVLVKH